MDLRPHIGALAKSCASSTPRALGIVMLVIAGCAKEPAVVAPDAAPLSNVEAGAPVSANLAPSAAPSASSSSSPPTHLPLTSLRPGAYGTLEVAVDRVKDSVTGTYSNGTGDDGHGHPQFTCAFTFRGVDTGAADIPVVVHEGALHYAGTVRIVGPAEILVRFDQEPGGCWNVDSDIGGHIAKEGTHFFAGAP